MIDARDYHSILLLASLPISGVSVADSGNPYVNQWASPPSEVQRPLAESILASARIVEFSATGSLVSVLAPADVSSVDVLVGSEPITVALSGGAGELEIIFPEGVVSRVVKAANQQVNGTREVVVVNG